MDNFIVYPLVIFLTVFIGFHLRLLSRSGAVAAFCTGEAVAIGFGWRGLLVLGLFFLSSSLWSNFKREQKKRIEQKHVKGSRRDWQQVVANGALAAIFGLFSYFGDQNVWLLPFFIALAAANSDTWASEIGSLSKNRPLFIRTFRRVEKGTSGAISLLGTFAGLSGAFLIAIASWFLFSLSGVHLVFIFLFGFFGNLLDTVLGAFWQAAYHCPVCSAETEKMIHCQKPAKMTRGKAWMNNDAVNFLSGLAAAIVGMIVWESFM
jgi:uncharacterized protein (TIGR00297 family)